MYLNIRLDRGCPTSGDINTHDRDDFLIGLDGTVSVSFLVFIITITTTTGFSDRIMNVHALLIMT